MAGRIDWPLNPFQANARLSTQSVDSGVGEEITITSTGTYPTGTSPAWANNPSSDRPLAYDCKGSRSVTIQIDSANVTGAGTFQILVSTTGIGYAPVYVSLTPGATPVTSIPIPTGGTPTAPLATIVALDAPWFRYMQISVNAAASAGTATLTITHRS